ncbi:UPF0759 protein YunF [Paenibacillus sp. J31TS4]|uniref:DUF72 domain-containing protein n=1 Tax=Paenibacillus sp. J31TS4 TaxID=2807195 RepID=UPI001B02A28F|nr:DUF72 domain-containing protein [Paenibacillus sp. J31TS4]GIP40393.1 UPF0759 protein YunF [Paenibacillus sp. J31TS4]
MEKRSGIIRIGLAGWGDHAELYPPGTAARDKLSVYSGHFPVVEVDSSFYAVQAERNYERWAADTPDGFGFLVKAYQGMTGHQRGKLPFETVDQMYAAFLDSIRPLRREGKLLAVLFQFPPWFDCNRDHVEVLRDARERMGDIPVALEFRHESWFHPAFREKTLAFMEEEGWIHSICDEPEAGPGSVPTVLHPTSRQRTVVRFHGRNTAGWNQSGAANWRDVRYLYRYSREELLDWAAKLEKLRAETYELIVIFNNNSGGDAAANAKQLTELLGLGDQGLAPRQLDLFE